QRQPTRLPTASRTMIRTPSPTPATLVATATTHATTTMAGRQQYPISAARAGLGEGGRVVDGEGRGGVTSRNSGAPVMSAGKGLFGEEAALASFTWCAGAARPVAAGTVRTVWHPGHLTRFPATSSSAR